MRTVPILRDDLEPVNRLLVPDDIFQDLRSVLFYPRRAEKPRQSNVKEHIPWQLVRVVTVRGSLSLRNRGSHLQKTRLVSHVQPDVQHLTRFAETSEISSDHVLGDPIFIATPSVWVNKTPFYNQGITLGITTKTAP